MRDFNAGDIHGDVSINDNSSNIYKNLNQCTAAELLEEEQCRLKLLREEKAMRRGRVYKLLGVAVLFGLGAAGWFFLRGSMDAVAFVLGFLAVVVAFAGVKRADTPTDFELRQAATLRDIRTLLRERGAR
ncbi:hypothetical protein [Stenotrophomonas sp.]|uniref:hypothetical protein n=1 Tax=Stenotrophomonas sp. TaxID=69392 RepID=UPI00289EDD1A|nr:hypothetical protein [Stenotrophomonas sp.]